MRQSLIKCSLVTWVLIHFSATSGLAQPMTAAPASPSIFWQPIDFTGTNITENASSISNSPTEASRIDGINASASPLAQSIGNSGTQPAEDKMLENFQSRLAAARNLVNTRQFNIAEPTLVGLLAENVPDEIRQTAMLNLGVLVQAENDLPRAQSIFTQFLERWPGDPRVPEILLRQGDIFRQMGLNNLALGKFYSVMTAALSLKSDQFANYQRLVFQAQVQIAETHYQSGRFAEAVEFYSRLLIHIDNSVDRPQIQFRLIRSLNAIGKHEEATGQAQDFLTHHPEASEEPEVRYYLAQSLKAGGQSGEALRQVLIFLRDQKGKTKDRPEVWAYWQQRVGNEIANQLYKEGDYVKALEVYRGLSQLDSAPAWRLPVDYQVGITYERLLQPQMAIDTYNQILGREAAVGTNATPALKAVFEMSRWRIGYLGWQSKAEADIHAVTDAAIPNQLPATNFTSETIAQ